MQPEWFDEIEIILDQFANGQMDSTLCMHELAILGYNEEDIKEIVNGQENKREMA